MKLPFPPPLDTDTIGRICKADREVGMFLARRLVNVIAAAGMLAGLVVFVGAGAAQTEIRPDVGVLRDGFETPEPVWQREYTDTTVRLDAQERSDRAAHGGRLSERFSFHAGNGSQFFVSYATPQIVVSDELTVSLHVRTNRAGVQVFARIVLPADSDPETKAPSFVLVPGPICGQTDRWERLELAHMVPAIERQARVLRSSTRRRVSLEGAYLERVVVNLLGGPGECEVFLDDLEIRPVAAKLLAEWARAAEPGNSAGRAIRSDSAKDDQRAQRQRVRLERNRLLRIERVEGGSSYVPWFPTAIDAPGADVTKLRRANFDLLAADFKSEPERLRTAVERGFLLMPRLSGASWSTGPQSLLEQIAVFPQKQSVVFWHIGDHLGRGRKSAVRQEELTRLRAAVAALRGLPDNELRPVTATVDGELTLFAQSPTGLDLIGIQPRLWGGAQSLLESYTFLIQRRALTVLSNLEGLLWAWIPAAAPPGVVRNIWGDDAPPAWGTPPVQPEQLRLMTYLALSAGYRGLVFAGDAELTRPAGRALLIEMSFLNLEIDLCEEILAQNVEPIPLYSVYDPDPPVIPPNATNIRRPRMIKELTPRPGMRAASIALRDRKGALLLVGDYADNAQYQPPQLAAHNITITPVLPEGAQCFEISPGEVKVLEPLRVPGGTRFIIEDFGITSMVLCTTDLSLYQRVQALVDSVRPKAIPMAIEQAEILFAAVRGLHERLEADGHGIRTEDELKRRRSAGIGERPRDAKDLLGRAEEYIKSAREAYERDDYAWAWSEARRASRPLRILMHGYWSQAYTALVQAAAKMNPQRPKPVPGGPKPPTDPPLLVTPISAPPCISFYTLPELHIWADWIAGKMDYGFGRNRLPSGDFNDPDALGAAGWANVGYELDGFKADISTVPITETNPDHSELDLSALDRSSNNRALKMVLSPERAEEVDSALPFLDFPVAAVRSPPIRVEANNLVRISVLVKRPYASPQGMGGIIVRDSIGGEQFQFRTSSPIPGFSRVVLFRKAPADGTFTVTLGLAGYREAYFDDLRVEVIEAAPRPVDPNLAQGRGRSRSIASPNLPDPRVPASASRPLDSRRQQR
jgi:hypothetical protein